MPAARGERFYSEAWGEQQLLPNGNVLITESYGGRVFEVTREAQPRVVWSWVNHIGGSEGPPRGGVVGASRRFAPGELPFVESREIAGKTPAGQPPSVQTLATPPAPG